MTLSPAEATGSSVRHTLDLLDAAEAMKVLPATEAKFRTGALTERQATDEDERHRRAHRRRYFRHWVDVEGSFRFSGSLTPEAGAVLMAAMEPHRQALVPPGGRIRQGQAPAAGLRRRGGGRRPGGDGPVRSRRSSRPIPCGRRRRRWSTCGWITPPWERGHTERGEVCEVPGVGPVTVAWVRSLLPDAVVAALLVEDGEVLKVAHLGRFIPAKVRTALVERDRVCVVPGCSVDSDLEIDHIKPIAAGGRSRAGQPVPAVPVPPLPQDPPRLAHLPSGQTLAVGGTPRPPPDPSARQPELTAARC